MFGSSSHPILQASEQGPQATSGTRTSCTPCATRQGKYTVELFKEGGEGTGVERVLAGNDDLAVAVSLYGSTASTIRNVWLCSATVRGSSGAAIGVSHEARRLSAWLKTHTRGPRGGQAGDHHNC
jgi:hypothetical protein